MPAKKKVIKEKKQKKVKQKQSQSQKVIINLNEVKTKPKRTRKKATNKNIKFDNISTNEMPAGWAKSGAPDDREVNTLRGKLIDVENKLLSIKNVENPVNNDKARMLNIENDMKKMSLIGNNVFNDLYSKFDNIGDFSNKTKFTNPVKQEEKKQSQPIYTHKEIPKQFDEAKSRRLFNKTHYKEELPTSKQTKTKEELPTSKQKKTKEEKKIDTAIYQKNYREQQKLKKENIIKDQEEQRKNLNKDTQLDNDIDSSEQFF